METGKEFWCETFSRDGDWILGILFQIVCPQFLATNSQKFEERFEEFWCKLMWHKKSKEIKDSWIWRNLRNVAVAPARFPAKRIQQRNHSRNDFLLPVFDAGISQKIPIEITFQICTIWIALEEDGHDIPLLHAALHDFGFWPKANKAVSKTNRERSCKQLPSSFSPNCPLLLEFKLPWLGQFTGSGGDLEDRRAQGATAEQELGINSRSQQRIPNVWVSVLSQVVGWGDEIFSQQRVC